MEIGARFRTDDGREVYLPFEGIIGRMGRAALYIDDPRISEAHALVSLRGDNLKLLALRGRLSVDGKPRTEVVLTPGLRVVLAGFYGLTVLEIALPSTITAIVPTGEPTFALAARGVVSIHTDEAPLLRSGFHPGARAWVWTTEAGARLRLDGRDQTLQPRQPFSVDGQSFVLDHIPRSAVSASATADRGRFDSRLNLTLLFDAVHIHTADDRSATLDGLAARAICELHDIGQPISWLSLAQLLWPSEEALPPQTLRQRWDQLMTRLRMKLREAGIRSDVIRSTGQGLVELALSPHDTVEDRT